MNSFLVRGGGGGGGGGHSSGGHSSSGHPSGGHAEPGHVTEPVHTPSPIPVRPGYIYPGHVSVPASGASSAQYNSAEEEMSPIAGVLIFFAVLIGFCALLAGLFPDR